MSHSVKWKATLVVLLTIVVGGAVLFAWGVRTHRQGLDALLDARMRGIRNQLDLVGSQFFAIYQERLAAMARFRPEPAEVLSSRDPGLMASKLAPFVRQIASLHPGILHDFCLVDPAGSLLVRVDSPDDRLALGQESLKMAAQAPRTGKPCSGYCLDPDGVVFRVVQPVADQGRILGGLTLGVRVKKMVELVRGEDVEMAVLPAGRLDPGALARSGQQMARLGESDLLKSRSNVFDRLPPGFDFNGKAPARIGERWYLFDATTRLADFEGTPQGRLVFAVDVTGPVSRFRRFVLLGATLALAVVAASFAVLTWAFDRLNEKLAESARSLEQANQALEERMTELSEYRERLEDLVVERSVDLARANQDLVRKIEEKERAEEELRRSQASLAKAQQVARLGHWEWDVLKGRMIYSDQAIRIFGVPAAELTYTIEGVLERIHSEDRPEVKQALDRLLAEGTTVQFEFRIIRPNGKVRHVRSEAELTRDEAGRPLRMFGTIQDLTELRQATGELRLAANVFESSIEGIVITGADGAIQKVNRAFTQITGYAEQEVLGKNPRILKSDRHDAAFFQQMWDSLLEEGKWQGEIWNRRKNGEVYPQWLTITAIRERGGKVSHYVGVFHDMTELKLHEERLRYQAYYDTLTSLPNRMMFRERLAAAMHRVDQGGARSLAVLFLDLDNFKRVNDSLGHSVGDLLLKEVAARLRHSIREEDTVARYGGDEFICIIQGIQSEEDAVLAARRITEAIEPPYMINGHDLYLTASIGIAFYPEDGEDHETLVRNADTAMYRAKEEGKNTFQKFTPAMSQRVSDWLAAENSLRRALERQEFLLHYQPKMDLRTGKIIGAEALIRWQDQSGNLIAPQEFIPLAEDTGLVVAMGEWVLEEACRTASGWLADGHRIQVSVNLSTRQLRQENLVETIHRTLQRSGLPPELLSLEITESTVMENEEKAVTVLNVLKEMGVELAVDDFGTGYSSLYYLKHLPLDVLKIDRRFVRDLLLHEDDFAITAAIISMAKSLRLKVVAEGVETSDQLAFLRDRGCDQMQGYYFSPPVEAEEFLAMVVQGKNVEFKNLKQAGQIPLPFEA